MDKVTMDIETYVSLVSKYFSFLLQDYGFRIVYQDEYRKGYEWFRVGMESGTVRILFVRERGGGVPFIGPSSAPFDDEENPQWMNMMHLLSFVLKEKMDWRSAGSMAGASRVETVLSFYAEKLRPVCSQVMGMFATRETMASWYSLYEQYLDENLGHWQNMDSSMRGENPTDTENRRDRSVK